MKTIFIWLTSVLFAANTVAQDTGSLLATLKKASEKGIMFGHQDSPCYGIGWEYEKDNSDVKRVCGDYPAVMGFDLGQLELGHKKNLDNVPFNLIREEIIKQHLRGGISTLSWHVVNPLTGGSAWDNKDTTVVASILPGGKLHYKFSGWMDTLADFLLSLQTADGQKIPVLFRPWHEHTGSWFWWGQNICSQANYKALWTMLRQHLEERGVQHILYAYSPGIEPKNEDDYLERYPGDEYIDLLGFDYYQSEHSNYSAEMTRLLNILSVLNAKNGKPIAITETGFNTIPDSAWWTKTLLPLLQDYPLSYVLVWRNTDKLKNHYFVPYPGQASAADFQKFYKHPRTLFAKDMKHLPIQTALKSQSKQ